MLLYFISSIILSGCFFLMTLLTTSLQRPTLTLLGSCSLWYSTSSLLRLSFTSHHVTCCLHLWHPYPHSVGKAAASSAAVSSTTPSVPSQQPQQQQPAAKPGAVAAPLNCCILYFYSICLPLNTLSAIVYCKRFHAVVVLVNMS